MSVIWIWACLVFLELHSTWTIKMVILQAQELYKRYVQWESNYKLKCCTKDMCKRYVQKICTKDICKRSVQKICTKDMYKRCVQKICAVGESKYNTKQDLCKLSILCDLYCSAMWLRNVNQTIKMQGKIRVCISIMLSALSLTKFIFMTIFKPQQCCK